MRIPCRFCDRELGSLKDYVEHLASEHDDIFLVDVERVTNTLLANPGLLGDMKKLMEGGDDGEG